MATNISRIKINASKKRVWDVLTSPELVKLWQYGSDLHTTWQIGSPIRFSTIWEDKIFEQWGKVLQILPTEIIQYSLFAPRPGLEDKPENYFVMTYTLEDDQGQTLLTIIQEDNRPDAVQEKPQGEDNPVLVSLKNIAETI